MLILSDIAYVIMGEMQAAAEKNTAVIDKHGNLICSSSAQLTEILERRASLKGPIPRDQELFADISGSNLIFLDIVVSGESICFVALESSSVDELLHIAKICTRLATSIVQKHLGSGKKSAFEHASSAYFEDIIFTQNSSESIYAKAIAANINPEQPYYVAVVRLWHDYFDDMDIMSYNGVIRQLSSSLERCFVESSKSYLLFSGGLFIVIAASREYLRDCLIKISQEISNEKYKVICAVSIRAQSSLEIRQRYLDAKLICQNIAGPQKVMVFQEDCPLELMIERIPKDAKQVFVSQIFKDCVDADIAEWDRIVRILYSNEGSITKSAEELFVHKNTLQYRLGKIKERIDLDARSSDDAVILRTAFLAWKSLNNAANKTEEC